MARLVGAAKTVKQKRDLTKNTYFNESELEKVEWAAAELGLDLSVYLRYAALRVSKETIG